MSDIVISSSPPGKPQVQVTYSLHVQYIPRERQKVHFLLETTASVRCATNGRG